MNYSSFFEKTDASQGHSVELNSINIFEKENSIILPSQYKNCLVETNGGYPSFEYAAFTVQDFYGDNQLIIIESIYSFSEFTRELNDIRTQRDYTFEDFVKIGMIARCRRREFIFIGIAEDNSGKIYFAPDDNVTEFVSEDNDSGIYPIFEIAPDLDSFFTMLKHPGEFDSSFYE